MKIFLWGAYQQGNFGDDLMALIFTKAFSEMGHEVLVFGLSRSEAADFNLQVTSDVGYGVYWADVVVLGGGAIYDRWWTLKDVARTVLSRHVRSFELRYFQFGQQIKRSDKPLLMMSVGSDGVSRLSQVSPFRRTVLTYHNIRLVTLRLKQDMQLLSKSAAQIEHYPDILFSTPLVLPELTVPRTVPAVPRSVLLNLHKKHADHIPVILEAIRQVYGNQIRIIASRSHLAESGLTYEWMPKLGDMVEAFEYRGIRSMISALNTVDLVISSKLHIGIAGLALGTGFLSLGGRPKVSAQLDEIGLLDKCYINPNGLTVELMSLALMDIELKNKTFQETVARLRRDSKEHLICLKAKIHDL